jgi:hypothetical protein
MKSFFQSNHTGIEISEENMLLKNEIQSFNRTILNCNILLLTPKSQKKGDFQSHPY